MSEEPKRNGKLNGSGSHPVAEERSLAKGSSGVDDPDVADAPDPEPPPEELEPMPPLVADLAASCVQYVLTKYRVKLDFTPETLGILDQYVRDARADIAIKPDAIDLLQSVIGAYLGEVIRRAHFGIWQADGEQDSWRVLMTRVYLTFNPIGMAREALTLEPAEGWHAFAEVDPAEKERLLQRLEAIPPVEEEEYYAPTTRAEVIDIAVETLACALEEAGHVGTRFSREDYN